MGALLFFLGAHILTSPCMPLVDNRRGFAQSGHRRRRVY